VPKSRSLVQLARFRRDSSALASIAFLAHPDQLLPFFDINPRDPKGLSATSLRLPVPRQIQCIVKMEQFLRRHTGGAYTKGFANSSGLGQYLPANLPGGSLETPS
jgi:hypothetical protein